MKRFLTLLSLALGAFLVAAPAATAGDNGVGLWGHTDEKTITFWGFAVIAFFAILVIVLSVIQGRLESRKERARDELDRLRQP